MSGNNEVTKEEMTDWAVREVLLCLGKGADLREACASIVNASAHWGAVSEKK